MLGASSALGPLLAACGGSDGASPTQATAGSGSAGASTSDGDWILVQRFPQDVQGPGPLRLPISRASELADLLQDGPAELSAVILDESGAQVAGPITASFRPVPPAPYYDFRVELEQQGVYFLVVDGGPADGAAFQVVDPATISVPLPGQLLAALDTPTFDDPRGVDPICTREPEMCPFHEVTLTEALTSGGPVAYYVGTPAFCSTGSCGPALDSLIELSPEFPSLTFVHAEVYTDNTATVTTEAVAAAGMTYEPALFLVGADGRVIERLDAVWGTDELRDVFTRLT